MSMFMDLKLNHPPPPLKRKSFVGFKDTCYV